ncbi:hypothetical protein [Brevibacillus laterosporus]|nr:hypothetical protein [Brevibacillus laterosporus]MDN9011600.1 hypothetical protein [Brevibacillus laterosporus]MDO0942577.1 hypothetical protein [Brevibacillus laterosporus]
MGATKGIHSGINLYYILNRISSSNTTKHRQYCGWPLISSIWPAIVLLSNWESGNPGIKGNLYSQLKP